MTQEPGASRDPWQSDHERKVADIERERGETYPQDEAAGDDGDRPTSAEDLAADRDERYEDADVVGDDETSPGQNSDRLPQ